MNKIILLFSLFIVLISKSHAIDLSQIPEEELMRVEWIADQFQQGQRAIWPTLDWKESPLIVAFESGHYFAFHLNSSDPVWQSFLIKGVKVQATTQDKWGLKGLHMQAWFEIEGKQAFVYRMSVLGDLTEDVAVLAHERFHRHQNERFITLTQGNSRDHLDEENLTWSAIEDLLLRDFLKANEGEKLGLIKDFIAVNQMRRGALHEDSVLWEDNQLRMEGLADYAATKALGGEKVLLKMHPYDESQSEFIDDTIKWRHYLAGAAIGYALDFLKAEGWKEKIESGENLADLLAKQVLISKEELSNRLIKVGQRLNYKKRRRIASSKIHGYLQELDEIEQDYQNKEGIPLFVAHPRLSISGGGSNEKMIHLMEGGTVGLKDASIATTSDGSWRFETQNASHLYMHANGVREVKMAGSPRIKKDQISLKMEKFPQEYLFDCLEIEAENIQFSSKEHLGILIADEWGLRVSLLP